MPKRKTTEQYRKIEQYRRNNPVAYRKQLARWALRRKVSKGAIVRPDECSKCGQRAAIEAHHEDYSKPFEVIWLCRPCHRQVHKERDK